jgi:hypothetical protein
MPPGRILIFCRFLGWLLQPSSRLYQSSWSGEGCLHARLDSLPCRYRPPLSAGLALTGRRAGSVTAVLLAKR